MAVYGDSNIIQMKIVEVKTLASRSSSSWGEVHSNYRASITPKRSDSKILITFFLTMSSNQEHRLQHYLIRNVSASSYISQGSSSSGRDQCTAASRGSHNFDNAENISISGWVDAGSTSSRTYGLWHKSHSGNQSNFNHSQTSGTSGVHWTSTMIIQLLEMEDI